MLPGQDSRKIANQKIAKIKQIDLLVLLSNTVLLIIQCYYIVHNYYGGGYDRMEDNYEESFYQPRHTPGCKCLGYVYRPAE